MANGLVGEVWYTWIEFPGTSRREAAQPLSVLTSSARSFARSFAPVAALAVVGLWANRRRLERWMVIALAWVALALVLDLSQFWWRYLYWDASVPLSLFAVLGVLALWQRRSTDRRAVLGTCAVVALLAVYALTPHTSRFAKSVPDPTATFRDADVRAELRAEEEPLYGELRASLAVLREPDALPGPIVVFGSPIVQMESDRAQAGRIPGFLANTLGPKEWREFAAQIRATSPAYVFIGEVQGVPEDEFLQSRGVEVATILAESYCNAGQVPAGRWLVLCRPITGAPAGARVAAPRATGSGPP